MLTWGLYGASALAAGAAIALLVALRAGIGRTQRVTLGLLVAFVAATIAAALPWQLLGGHFWCNDKFSASADLAGNDLLEEIGDRVAALRWRPCFGRSVEVTVEPTSLDAIPEADATAQLIATATKANTAVSIVAGGKKTSGRLHLEHESGAVLDNPVVLPGQYIAEHGDLLSLVLNGGSGPMLCRLNGNLGEATSPTPELGLDELLGDMASRLGAQENGDDSQTVIHIRCRTESDPRNHWRHQYINVGESTTVVIAGTQSSISSNNSNLLHYLALDPLGDDPSLVPPSAFDLAPTVKREGTTVSRNPKLKDASLIILDRVDSRQTIEEVFREKRPGVPVVIVAPRPSALPEAYGLPSPNTAGFEVWDRRPRLTFVQDDGWASGAPGMDKLPTIPCFGDEDRCRAAASADTAEFGKAYQIDEAEAHRQFYASFGNDWSRIVTGDAQLNLDDADLRDLSAAAYRVLPLRSDLKGSMSDRARIEGATVDSMMALANAERRVARGETEAAQRRVGWENELQVLMTHFINASPCRRTPNRQQAPHDSTAWTTWVFVADAYACTLSHLYGDSLGASEGVSTRRLFHPPNLNMDAAALASRSVLSQDAQLDDYKAIDSGNLGDLLRPNTRLQSKVDQREVAGTSLFSLRIDDRFTTEIDAPTRFSALEQPKDTRNALAGTTYSTASADELRPARRVTSFGTFIDASPVLVLASSPFLRDAADESLNNASPLDVVPLVDGESLTWAGAVPDSKHPLLGAKLIRQFHRATRAAVRQSGYIARVSLEPDGDLRFSLVADPSATLAAVELKGTTPPIRAILVGADATAGTLEYAVAASDLAKVIPEGTCKQTTLDLPEAEDPPKIWACAPDVGRTSPRTTALEQLSRVAQFTGGCSPENASTCESSAPRPLHLHDLGIRLAVLAVFGLLGQRAARRLWTEVQASGHRLERSDASRRFDSPAALVSSRGDWDQDATTWQRVGSFGGYRPLQPGDRVSATVLTDLILMQAGRAVIPRVTQRIRPGAPPVCVVVNTQGTMRSGPNARRKLETAAMLAELVCSQAWTRGSVASVYVLRGDQAEEIIERTSVSPGAGAVMAAILDLPTNPTAKTPDPAVVRLEDVGSAVFVSDMQLEHPTQVARWATDLESRDIRVAGIMVTSPVEQTMVEGGFLAGQWCWVDRAGWSAEDVRRLQDDRLDQFERAFDLSTGGLAWVNAGISSEDALLTLDSGRVLSVMR